MLRRRSFRIPSFLPLIATVFSALSLAQQEQRPQTPVFESLSIEDGLPENSVCCMLQDHRGYLWIGTQNGLARYDGYSIKVFSVVGQRSSGSNPRYDVAIFEDRDSVLWVATANGLGRFNPATESFATYTFSSHDSNTISSSYTRCICQDKKGRLWVGTFSGLNLLDRERGIFTRYYLVRKQGSVSVQSSPGERNLPIYAVISDPSSGDILIGTELQGVWRFNVDTKILSKYEFASGRNFDKQLDHVQSFYASRDGNIWICSYNALARLDPYTGECRLYLEFPISDDERYPYPTSVYGSVTEDRSGLIWAGFYAEGEGIFSIDPKTGAVHRYDPFERKEKNTYEGRILSIYVDRSDILWIGTWLYGLKKWDRRKHQFDNIQYTVSSSETFASTYSMCYDSTGLLWSSTDRGLYRYDLRSGQQKSYFASDKSLTDSLVMVTLRDASGQLWLGTRHSGFLRFDPHRESSRRYFNTPPRSIQKPFVAMQERSGNLWIGTDGFGLYRYDIGRDILIQFRHDWKDSTTLTDDRIRSIYEDRRGALWVGTNNWGLEEFDRGTETFLHYGFECVLAIFEDTKGRFWIGDLMSGLSLFDRDNSTIVANYSRRNGLISNAVWGIQEDAHGNLWLETDHGLLKFNPETESFRRYTEEDGLSDNFLKPFGNCRGSDGAIYFLSQRGIVAFHPDSIRDDPTPPKVVITNVSLYDRPGESLGSPGFLSAITELTLAYDQNNLEIDYVGLHFSQPERNGYKYFLENFDKEWVNTGNLRRALYTNLEPGRYVFHVRASNRDGIWSEEAASLAFIITPPWWRTWWAYGVYALALLAAVYSTWMLQLRRVKTKHALEMTRFEAEKLHQVDEMKSSFFTNISHEFRTPLTLILGPVKQVAERIEDERAKQELSMVHRNAQKLLTLVNQLLDISKVESGSMKLRASPVNIVPVLRALVVSFTPYAERKRITLKFNTTDQDITAYTDREKIESIVTNILSNAFKFTPEGGRIELNVSRHGKVVKVQVSDTGIGIPQEKLSKIFDRFYQVDGTHTREQEGTGIGLALTKELIELHKGTIVVESEEGKGTVATICIPLGKDHLKPEEILERPPDQESHVSLDLDAATLGGWSTGTAPADPGGKLENPLLLLVEDNSDVRYYIRGILEKDYILLEADDGEEGSIKATDRIPDVIVSDVMMPKMDGFELCRKLKTDERTSHIPLILLTAKASIPDKIKGLETGADAYIMKPFEPEELKARIRNLIEQRTRLQEHFKQHGLFSFDDSKVLSIDRKFLEKIQHIITENMGNSSFGVESLAEMAAVSHSVLHRKIVSLTGEPPVELIRRIRMTRAAALIQKKFGNLTQIALEVGFENPSYFSGCFKKQFGISPSQYARNLSIL